MFGHKHKWKEIVRTYTGGYNIETQGISADDFLKLRSGVTTILWECEICHKLRKEELMGEETKCQ